MTLKIQAYQKYGKKTKKLVEEFESCCWQDLFDWLKHFSKLHQCPKCKKEKIDEVHKSTEGSQT